MTAPTATDPALMPAEDLLTSPPARTAPASPQAAQAGGAAATNAAAQPPGSAMDAAFIERNQIVERYLSGKLPARGAGDFERFCREHPELLTSLGLPERINAGLRLMDAAGHPEPWAEKETPFYQKPLAIAGVAALAGTMLIATLMLLFNNGALSRQIGVLEDQLRKQPLLPAESTRTVVVAASRNGPISRPMVTIGGARTVMADLKFDVSWSKFTNYRVTIDRLDQGRVMTLGNVARDSNGHLRIALNSSALGPGDYTVTMDGIDRMGTPLPQAWASFAVAR